MKVFCVIVTFNGMEWINKCLQSLVHSTTPLFIIVIDNGSTDGTVDFIQSNYPFVTLIKSVKNLGFGQANNIGIAHALEKNADYIFLLNQDAWVEHDTIMQLIRSHRSYPQFGIVSPLHFNGAVTGLDQYFAEYLRQSEIDITENVPVTGTTGLFDVQFVNAAAWLIPAECIIRCGKFDPVFFHYGEDLNFAHRVLFHGFRIGVHPEARIYHDREARINSEAYNDKKKLNRDWIFFLNNACDIRKNTFPKFVLKRLVRHSLFSLVSLLMFSKRSFVYHSGMATRIALHLKKISQSRRKNKLGKQVG